MISFVFADDLDKATCASPASIRPRRVPLMTRHNDSVHQSRTGRASATGPRESAGRAVPAGSSLPNDPAPCQRREAGRLPRGRPPAADQALTAPPGWITMTLWQPADR